jgi:hypothetical protein
MKEGIVKEEIVIVMKLPLHTLGKPMTNLNSTNHIIRLVVTIFVVAAIAIGAYFTPAFADDPGYALSFDGIRQYVRLGNTSTVMGNSAWVETKSVTLWVKVTGNSPPTSLSGGEMIFSTDNPQLFGMVRAISSGRDRLWVWNGDANGPDFVGVDFTPGEWMHLAVVHQGGVLSLYKNGILAGNVASGPTYIPYGVYVGVLYLGGSGRLDTSTYFDGQIDEVAFWDVALDLPSITGLMNNVITDAHPLWNHLKAYYRMSDGAGTSLSDDSAYSNTGSLLGGMSDANWVLSGAFGGGQVPMTPTGTFALTSTFTATPTGLPATSTATRTPTSTPTIMPATVTSTYTSQPASATPSLTNTPFQPSPTASSIALPTVTSTPGASESSLIEVGFCALPSN